jgi:hypothetical protein
MKKLAQWERKKREQASAFADRVNGAEAWALDSHEAAVEMEVKGASPIAPGDPKWRAKLLPAEETHLEVAAAVKAYLLAAEAGDQAACGSALDPFGRLLNGRQLEVYVATDGKGHFWRQPRPLKAPGSFPQTEAMVDDFFEYVERTSEFLNLGVCHQCGKVYLKTKQGAKMLYCSRACGQKAYRERQRRASD